MHDYSAERGQQTASFLFFNSKKSGNFWDETELILIRALRYQKDENGMRAYSESDSFPPLTVPDFKCMGIPPLVSR